MNKLFCAMLLCGLASLVGCKGFEECGQANKEQCGVAANFEASALPCKWNPEANDKKGACEKDIHAQGSGTKGSGTKGSGANQ